MARILFPTIAASLACLALAGCEQTPMTAADMNKPAPRCFQVSDFQTWRATPDGKSMYVRTSGRNYYRVDMVNSCRAMTRPGAFLITTFRGPTTVCSNLDWDLKVSEVGGFPIPCIVESQTPLTPAEAALIPEGSRPN